MSVKKATMVNIIGKIQDYDRILNDIIITKKVEAVSAIGQIEKNNFLLEVNNQNVERLVDINFASHYEGGYESKDVYEKGKELASILDIELESEPSYEEAGISLEDIKSELYQVSEDVIDTKTMLGALKQELKYLDDFHVKSFNKLPGFETSLSELREMDHFEFKLGILSKDKRNKLKKDYDSILAVIKHTGSSADGEVYMFIYPTNQEEEISRVLRANDFKEIILPKEYKGNPKEILSQIEVKKENLRKEISVQKKVLEQFKLKHEERLKYLLSQLHNIRTLEDVKKTTMVSDKYFYFSGVVSPSNTSEVKEVLKGYDDLFILFYEDEDFDERGKGVKKEIKASGEITMPKLNDKDYMNSFGLALYEMDQEIDSIRKKHDDTLRKKKLEGQNRVNELERELLEEYIKEAEARMDGTRSKREKELLAKQGIPMKDAIDQVEQEYLKIKPNLLETLWENIVESKE